MFIKVNLEIKDFFRLAVLLLVWLSACTSNDVQGTPAPTGQVLLTPYWTRTVESIEAPTRIVTPVPIPAVPTPTPLVYSVVTNDTMIGIAFRYGITLNELLASNPDVDPQFLSVGTELIIPINGGETALEATATPIPLVAQAPRCYPGNMGGSWCFLLISNDQDFAIENITAAIDIYTADGENLLAGEMTALINALPPDASMPLVFYTNQNLPQRTIIEGRILSAIPIAEDDERYVEAELAQVEIEIVDNGSQARVSGWFQVFTESKSATIVWVLVIAYDEDGNVAGVRRFEHIGEVPVGTDIEFSLWVYSLGRAIKRVDTLIEARP